MVTTHTNLVIFAMLPLCTNVIMSNVVYEMCPSPFVMTWKWFRKGTSTSEHSQTVWSETAKT